MPRAQPKAALRGLLSGLLAFFCGCVKRSGIEKKSGLEGI